VSVIHHNIILKLILLKSDLSRFRTNTVQCQTNSSFSTEKFS